MAITSFASVESLQGLAAAGSTSLLCSLLILMTQRWHASYSLDRELIGAQKFHTTPVPRVGGVALLAGLICAAAVTLSHAWSTSDFSNASTMGLLILSAIPAFLAGLGEDLTKRVSVTTRLIVTFASPLIASWTVGATLNRIDIWGIDWLLQFMPLALVVTAVAVAGISNAWNIIDGFNGLAGFTGLIVLAALAWAAHGVGDQFLVEMALVGMGAVAGFLLLNYPTGRLFLGDGGAYLLGFWIAELAVLMVLRNPEVSAWQMLAICAYPVIEVVYSIYRKKIVRGRSPGMPDRLHFHMLVHRRLICCVMPKRAGAPWLRNAVTTLALLLFITPFAVAAALWGGSPGGALTVIMVQVLVYLALYARLVRGHWHLNPAVGLGLRSEHHQGSRY